MSSLPAHIVFFDGICNLCNRSVQFIIREDSKSKFTFASLQWRVSREILKDHYPAHNHFESILYYEKGKIHSRSTAVLRICKNLPFPWPLLYMLVIVPRFIRDFVYKKISQNRYRWFGKKENCMVPWPGWENKFLDSSL